jgi:hypothetical protein
MIAKVLKERIRTDAQRSLMKLVYESVLRRISVTPAANSVDDSAMGRSLEAIMRDEGRAS